MQKVVPFWFVICALFLGACAMHAPSAEAYILLRKSENFREMAWKRSKFPVSIVLDSAGTPDVPLATLESVIKLSLGAWNAVDCTVARFKYSGVASGKQAPFADGVNVIKFVQSAANWSKDWSAQQFAVTVVRALVRTGEILDADILLNDWNFKFGTNGVPKEADLQATLTHELGHVLGIGHSLDTGASMAATANVGETNKRKLNNDDRAAVCDLYPIQPCKENQEKGDKVCYNGRYYSICAPYQQACVPCNFDEECHGPQNFCLNTNFGKLCGVGCGPNTKACESGYTCEPVTDGNDRLIGRNCAPSVPCANLQKYPCCRNDDDCMPTYSCKQNSCVRGNICRQLTETCSAQQTCCPGMQCVNDGSGARCRKPCDPLAPQCDRGTRCALAEKTDGFCVPPNGGGKDGDVCDNASKKCEYELYCDPKESRCRYLCKPGTNTCPVGYACKALANTAFGLCYKGGRDCKTSAECPQGQVCQNNLCRPCGADSECPPRYKCLNNSCQAPCTQNSDCPRQQFCDKGICKAGIPCTQDSECTGGFICINGTCTDPSQGSCKTDADCGGNGKVCANGKCVLSDTCNNKCAATERCSSGQCVPNTCTQGQCPQGFKCVNSQCVKDKGDCGGKGPCPQGKECYNNLCVSQLGSACVGDEDCLAGLTCVKGVNIKRCSKPCGLPSDCPPMFNQQATSCIKLDGIGKGCWPNGELDCPAGGECKLAGSGCGGCSTVEGEPPPMGGIILLLAFFGWRVFRRRRMALQEV